MRIDNFKLYSTTGPNAYLPRQGYGVTLLVEGGDVGATYYNKLPFTPPPKYVYTPRTLKVYNKALVTKMPELKANFGNKGLQFQLNPSMLKNKTFVYDVTPYVAYMKQKLGVNKYVTECIKFLQGQVDLLSVSNEEQIMLYYVDPSIIDNGVSIRNLYIFILLSALKSKEAFPYKKVYMYSQEQNKLRLIYDGNNPRYNNYGTALVHIRKAMQSKKISIDPLDLPADISPAEFEKIEPQEVPTSQTISTTPSSQTVSTKQPEPVQAPKEPPRIVQKVAIVTDDDAEAKNIVLPVAKKDPLAKANQNTPTVTKAEVDAAINDIVKNAKSMMSSYNVDTNTLASRLDALARAKPEVADAAVKSFNNQDAVSQMNLAKAAVIKEPSIKDAPKGEAVPIATADIQEQEIISHDMGLDKEENIDEVNDTKVVNKLMKNNIAHSIARRHNYQAKIVEDVKKEVSTYLNEVNYRVAKVWIDKTTSPETEIKQSQFDMCNIKCYDAAGKAVTLKFRIPYIAEDRYVVSGGLRWFFPTVMATLPIFIVKKYHSQVRTNYSSISFFYGVFNKQEDIRCFVGGYKIPFTLLNSLLVGITNTLKRYNISYEIAPVKPRDSSKTSLPLENGQFLVCNTGSLSTAQTVVMTGLKMMFKKYKFSDINSTQELYNCLRAYTKEPKSEYILRQTIKFIMDVQTVNVLKANKLPSVLSDIVPYCASLAMSGKEADKLSIENVYLRTTDIITTAIGKGVAQGISNFRKAHLYDPSKSISVDSGFVTKYLQAQGATQLLQYQNPVEEVSNYAEVRIIGPGGLPNADAVMVRDRAVRTSHFGNIDPTDTAEGDPGSKVYLSIGHMYDEKQHGFMKMDLTNSNTQIMGPAAATTPYLESDDQARQVMACSQARQAVPIQLAELPIIMTGAESTIPAMSSSTFAKKAKEDSVVEYIDKNCMILKGESGHEQVINLRPETLISGSGKNAAIEQKPLVKVGDKVSKFQILAQNQFIKPYLTQGKNVTCAYMSYSYNYEDAFVLSRSLADDLVSLHSDSIEVTLLSNDQIEKFPKIGEQFNAGDIVLRVKKSIVGNMALAEDVEIIAPERCKVADIKVYPNGDLSQVASIVSNVDEYYRETNKALAKAHREPIFDSSSLAKNAGKFTLRGIPVEGNLIILDIVTYMPVRLGDKLTNRHGGKGVVGKILPDDQMPYYMHNGQKVRIDLLYPNLCVVGRMNVGQLHELGATKVMCAATEKLENMYNSNTPKSDIENFLIDLYEGLDNTSGKVYSTQLAKNLRSMNDVEFKKYVEATIKSGLKLIAAPFQGDTIEQLMNAAKKLNLNFYEYVYLPEFGPKVKTMYPVAVGMMYIQKLEQISKIKVHSRNIGKYVKTTMQPTKGKARLGGQKFGEMDTNCCLAYPRGLDFVKEMYAVSADNQDVKKQVISDIVANGHADITGTPELSGAGEYFKNVVTGMGIDMTSTSK